MFDSILKCYDRLRLLSYRGLFRVLRERDTSLSAAEAYSVDVIYLLHGPTVKQFAKNVAATGCIHAYCLDGGQTATIVMNDELMNRPVYGQQRKISDIVYFATAVPEGGDDNG